MPSSESGEESSLSGEPLRVLLVEDVEDDAELVVRALTSAGITCRSRRVQSESALRDALQHFIPDVVLSDHSLPQFNAHDALRVVRSERPHTPVIIVTGSLDEETAAEYIKAGAADYIVKQRLHRIGPAVRRALALRRAVDDAARAEAARRHTIEFLSHAQTIAHIGRWEWGIVRDGAGRPTRLIGAVLDITARKQAEEALRQASDHLQAIIQSSPLAILSLDAERIVQTWNPAAERLFGWPGKEVVGRPVPIVPEEKEEECREARRRVLQGQLFTGVELIRRKKDGSAVTVNVFAAPLHDVEGRVAGILAVIEDVTAMKRLEQQFFQAQKMEAVGRLAGGVAHDFNNLLTAILGSTDLLLETLPADHPGREEGLETRKAALRAADLTRHLLAVSRQQVFAPRVVSLNEVVADMDKMLRRLIGEDVELRTVLPENLGAA